MKRPAPLDLKREEQRMRMWNDRHPSGTLVTLRTSADGSPDVLMETKTRSEAWLLGHGQAVVLVDGKSGGWALDRVTAVCK